jgi:hypothetical protein
VIGVLRWINYHHRWFLLSSAALLHAALHGLAGVPYLVAGAIALGAAVIAMTVFYYTRRNVRPNKRGAR